MNVKRGYCGLWRAGMGLVALLAAWMVTGCGKEGVAASPEGPGAEWLTAMPDAQKAAAERKVPILVDFSGSDWCGWCVKLDKEVFSKDEFQKFAKDKLVLLLIDFPRRKALPAEQSKANKELAARYGVQGFPTVLLLDAAGNELARTGYRPGGASVYVKHLEELLKESVKK